MTDAVYYRYEDYLEGSGGFDVHGDYQPGPSRVRVHIVTFEVVKKTPKGAWVKHPSELDGSMQTYFIADRWFKKYANPTQEGARFDFIARKRYLIAVQERRIRDARVAIAAAELNDFEPGLKGLPTRLRFVHAWEQS